MIDNIAQTLSALIIFVVVLAITYLVTRLIAGYQKNQMSQGNIKILETNRISQTKYLQLIQVGEVYLVIAVCKDTVTMLTTIEKDKLELTELESELQSESEQAGKESFREILTRSLEKKNKDNK